MTSAFRPDLLRPSLTDPAQVATAPYSLTALFFTAFFGGPLAYASLLGVNAWRLKRLRRDVVWVVLIVLAYLYWVYAAFATPTGEAVRAQLHAWLGRSAMSLTERCYALAAFLLGMWLHRAEQRSADLFGLKRPNGWIAGILMIVLGFALTWLYVRWMFG